MNTESSSLRPENVEQKLTLAAPLSAAVELLDVFIAKTACSRQPTFSKKGARIELAVSKQVIWKPERPDRLAVLPALGIRGVSDEQEKPFFAIEASYVLSYGIRGSNAFTNEQRAAFADLNAMYNVWPYWREFVQSTMTRMGLPPYTLPVFQPVRDLQFSDVVRQSSQA